MALGLPSYGVTFGADVAVAVGGDEGRQQGVVQAEQLPEDFPLHDIDPPCLLGGLLHEVPQGVELVLGLESGLLRV